MRSAHAETIAGLIGRFRRDVERGATKAAVGGARALAHMRAADAAEDLANAVQVGKPELQAAAAIALVEIGAADALDGAVINQANRSKNDNTLVAALYDYVSKRRSPQSALPVFQFVRYVRARSYLKRKQDIDAQYLYYLSTLELANAYLLMDRSNDAIELLEQLEIRPEDLDVKIPWVGMSSESAVRTLGNLLSAFELQAKAYSREFWNALSVGHAARAKELSEIVIRKYAEAEQFLLRARANTIVKFERVKLAQIKTLLAEFFLYYIEDYNAARATYQESIALASVLSDSAVSMDRDEVLLFSRYGNGLASYELRLLSEAEDEFKSALELALKLKLKLKHGLAAESAFQLALINHELARNERAASYAELATEISRESHELTEASADFVLRAFKLLGDIRLAQDQIAKSQIALNVARRVFGPLIERRPESAWLREWDALLRLSIGKLLRAQGRYAESIYALNDSKAIRKAMLARNPTNKAWMERVHTANVELFYQYVVLERFESAHEILVDESVLLDDIQPFYTEVELFLRGYRHKRMRAALLMAQGKFDDAVAQIDQQIRQLEDAPEELRDRPLAQELLSFSMQQKGDVLRLDSRAVDSAHCYQRALEITESLRSNFRREADYSSAKASIERGAAWAFAEGYDEAAALDWNRRALESLKIATKEEPADLGLHFDLVALQRQRIELLRGEWSFGKASEADTEEARSLAVECIGTVDKIGEPQGGHWVGLKCQLLRELAFCAPDTRAGIEFLEKALGDARALMNAQPESDFTQILVAELFVNLADASIEYDNIDHQASDKVLRSAQKYLNEAKRVIALQDRGASVDWRRINSIVRRSQGDIYFRRANFRKAAVEHRSNLKYREKTLAVRSKHPTLLRDVAFSCFRIALAIRSTSSASINRKKTADRYLTRGLEIWRGLRARFPLHAAAIDERINAFERALSSNDQWLKEPDMWPSYSSRASNGDATDVAIAAMDWRQRSSEQSKAAATPTMPRHMTHTLASAHTDAWSSLARSGFRQRSRSQHRSLIERNNVETAEL